MGGEQVVRIVARLPAGMPDGKLRVGVYDGEAGVSFLGDAEVLAVDAVDAAPGPAATWDDVAAGLADRARELMRLRPGEHGHGRLAAELAGLCDAVDARRAAEAAEDAECMARAAARR